MKHPLVKIFSVLVLLVAAHNSHAQTTTNPVGGLTIKTIQVLDSDWIFVEFVESDTVITNKCQAASTVWGTFPKVLWIEPGTLAGDKLFSTLLALQMANRPASGVTVIDMGNHCLLYAVRT